MEQRGLQLNINPVLLGFIFAIPTMLIFSLFPRVWAIDLVALLLVGIAAPYPGYAIAEGDGRTVLLEAGVAVLFLFAAGVGLWTAPWVLALGYFLHGLWDFFHHPLGMGTQVVTWWPPFCVVFDWLIAVYVIVWWGPPLA